MPDTDTGLLVSNVRQNDWGYWVVTISVRPGRSMSIMVCKQGITPMQAAELAVTGVTHVLGRVA